MEAQTAPRVVLTLAPVVMIGQRASASQVCSIPSPLAKHWICANLVIRQRLFLQFTSIMFSSKIVMSLAHVACCTLVPKYFVSLQYTSTPPIWSSHIDGRLSQDGIIWTTLRRFALRRSSVQTTTPLWKNRIRLCTTKLLVRNALLGQSAIGTRSQCKKAIGEG